MTDIIKLKMKKSKDIEILKNDNIFIVISKDNRNLNGQNLFDLFDYKDGNKYHVQKENSNNLDSDVLNELFKIIDSLAKSISEIESIENQTKDQNNIIEDIENDLPF